MKLLTGSQVAQVCATPGGMERVALYIDPLNRWMARFDIDTPNRACAFISQIMVETNELLAKREDLSYHTASRLLEVFPREVHDLADAQQLISRGAEAIANRVYANRLGNGNEASGDGWRFRGGGDDDTTGRAAYRRFGAELGIPLEDHPELIEQPEAATGVFALFWHEKGLNALADAGNLTGIRRNINGPACLGLDKSLVYFNRALKAGIGQ